MKKETFDLLHDAESSWLYRGRTEVVKKLIASFKKEGSDFLTLDMGAGFGGFYEILSDFGPSDAVEPNRDAKAYCIKRGYREIFDRIEDIKDGRKYDVIIACDVIEHVEDDALILSKIKDKLKDGGILVITVPAFNFLWTKRDDDHGHFRRYVRKTLKEPIKKSGLNLKYISYWNFILFPLAFAVRITGGSGDSSLNMPKAINTTLLGLLRLEISVMPSLSLPFGLTLVAVASKK